MKNKTILKVIFLSMVLASCGLIERFKTSDQPTDSKDGSANENLSFEADSADDLFSQSMNETIETSTDNPSNISSNDMELQSLQESFAPPENEAPIFAEEVLPEITTEVVAPTYSEEGQIKTYKVQRGETLMQISFKLYGDISKWKEIKNMNSDKLTNNSTLKTNTELKYKAPASPFVWNPSGTPYVIKSGDTLGTISNSVYSTPAKWKEIWNNNKPLIKNPNVIYAGFTLYYANGGMANFVQPKAAQPKEDILARELAKHAATREEIVEEVLAEETLPSQDIDSKISKTNNQTITDTQILSESDDIQVDQAIQTLSATNREDISTSILKTTVAPEEAEIDLINNISVPFNQEMEPDIDEEIQTL